MEKAIANEIADKVKRDYDDIAPQFSESRRGRFWPDIAFLLNYIEPGAKVLDIGCGSGRLLKFLADKNLDYSGIDNSQQLISIAQKEHASIQNADFMVANALNLPFADNTFDQAISIAVLHHIPSKEFQSRFFAEAHRVLKPGGVFILSVWNLWQRKYVSSIILEALKIVAGKSKLDIGDCYIPWKKGIEIKRYCHAFTVRALNKLARLNGFSVIESGKSSRNGMKPNLYLVAKK